MIESGGNYWDWVSAQEQITDEDVEDFGEILTEAYYTLKPHLDSMVWPECNILYLNQIYRIPQRKIGEYIGLSQYGVSKRLHSAIRRLKMKLKCPEHSLSTAKQELSTILSGGNLQTAVSYYYFNSLQVSTFLGHYTVISKVTNILKTATTDPINGALLGHNLHNLPKYQLNKNNEYFKIKNSKHTITKIANKYLPYFLAIKEITTVGESVFKNQERNSILEGLE